MILKQISDFSLKFNVFNVNKNLKKNLKQPTPWYNQFALTHLLDSPHTKPKYSTARTLFETPVYPPSWCKAFHLDTRSLLRGNSRSFLPRPNSKWNKTLDQTVPKYYWIQYNFLETVHIDTTDRSYLLENANNLSLEVEIRYKLLLINFAIRLFRTWCPLGFVHMEIFMEPWSVIVWHTRILMISSKVQGACNFLITDVCLASHYHVVSSGLHDINFPTSWPSAILIFGRQHPDSFCEMERMIIDG